jgi:type II secretory pathway component PulK
MFGSWFQRTHRSSGARRIRSGIGRTRRPSKGQAGHQDRRGVALLMVLVITTVMSGIAADLRNEAIVNMKAAVNARDQLQAYFHARSATELELFILRFQGQVSAIVGQYIPIPLFEMSGFLVSSDTMKGILNRKGPTPVDGRKKDSYALNKPFGDFDGSFWIEEVVDENRKVNINIESPAQCQNFMHTLIAAVIDDPKYDPLFETLFDSHDPLKARIDVIANITDWVDGNETVDTVCTLTGDQSTGGVAEDTRFERLPYNARYKPKNGQFTSLAELRLVPGVNDAFMRLFADYFTVWSDKKGIAMKTADTNMLRAVIRAISPPGQLLNETDERFQKFLTERALMQALPPPLNAMSKDVFMQLLDRSLIKYDPARLQDLVSKEMLRFDDISSVYRVTAMGRVGDATSTITLVWRDDRGFGQIFYWREE